jgi:F0F1-type ATP synthase assembly protein I
MAQSESDRHGVLRNLLIVLVGQVGCITLVVILVSVQVGLWMDAHFNTRPLYTLILLFAGIPLSVLLMLLVARKALARLMKEQGPRAEKSS